jgi:hypothetical protein
MNLSKSRLMRTFGKPIGRKVYDLLLKLGVYYIYKHPQKIRVNNDTYVVSFEDHGDTLVVEKATNRQALGGTL